MDRIINFYKLTIAENRAWFKISVNWFIISAFIGAMAFFIRPDLLDSIVSNFQERFGADPALDFNLVLKIFMQNALASGIGLFGGIFLGLGSVVVVAVNGFLLGFILASVIFSNISLAVSLALLAVGILPHGIFELPAFLLAGALGLRLGLEWIQTNAAGHRRHVLRTNLIQGLRVFPFIATVLFIAALIEVFVSGRVISYF